MRKIDRFDKYLAFKGLNDNKVTVQLGLSIGTLGKSRKEGRDLSTKVIEQILNFYTDLNRVWLLTGEGDMLVAETDKAKPSASATAYSSELDRLITLIEGLVEQNRQQNTVAEINARANELNAEANLRNAKANEQNAANIARLIDGYMGGYKGAEERKIGY